MLLDEYQVESQTTAIYPGQGRNLVYPTLGLCGEAGELANKVKKIQRDNNNILTYERKLELIEEAGDCLWYLAAICNELGTSLNFVASRNLAKLAARQENGTLHGSGDKR